MLVVGVRRRHPGAAVQPRRPGDRSRSPARYGVPLYVLLTALSTVISAAVVAALHRRGHRPAVPRPAHPQGGLRRRADDAGGDPRRADAALRPPSGPPLDPSGDEGAPPGCARELLHPRVPPAEPRGAVRHLAGAAVRRAASTPRPASSGADHVRRAWSCWCCSLVGLACAALAAAARPPAAAPRRRARCSPATGRTAAELRRRAEAALADGPPRTRRWSTASARWPRARSSAAGSTTARAPPRTRWPTRWRASYPEQGSGSDRPRPTSSTPSSTATGRPPPTRPARVLALDDELRATSPMSAAVTWLRAHRSALLIARGRGRRGRADRARPGPPAPEPRPAARPRQPRRRRRPGAGPGARRARGSTSTVVRGADDLERQPRRTRRPRSWSPRPTSSAARPTRRLLRAPGRRRPRGGRRPGPGADPRSSASARFPSRRRPRRARSPPAADGATTGLALQVDDGRGLRPGDGCFRGGARRRWSPEPRPGLTLLGAADGPDQRPDPRAATTRPWRSGCSARSDRLVWYVPALADLGRRRRRLPRQRCCPRWVRPGPLAAGAIAAVALVVWRARRLGPLAARAAAGRGQGRRDHAQPRPALPPVRRPRPRRRARCARPPAPGPGRAAPARPRHADPARSSATWPSTPAPGRRGRRRCSARRAPPAARPRPDRPGHAAWPSSTERYRHP